ncbi:hypothetical protein LBMAG42_40360 [Deltaproteobacteria bacterium]|nr:hypothetical protein LBMAG42_40360 [Deltaproteobacteria bacterium]
MPGFDPNDPYAEEDAAYEERNRLRIEAARALWAAREGLVALDDRPQSIANDALKRSLPSLSDADRVFTLVEASLGDRALRDVWSTPSERCLLVTDPERPEWVVPQRLMYLISDWRRPEPMQMHMELPPRIERIVARRKAKEEAEAKANPPEPESVVTLSPGGRPGKFGLYHHTAQLEITYGERGEGVEWMASRGDSWASSVPDEKPFTIDTLARPPQALPHPVLYNPGLLEGGVSVEVFAKLIAATRLDTAIVGRVRMPVPQPGGVCGAWQRALNFLKIAEWAGQVDPGENWVVIDAWNGSAMVFDPDRDEAFRRWAALVQQVQPLPPVERAPEPPRSPEPEPEAGEPEPGAVHKLPVVHEDRAVATTGMMQFVFVPPVIMAWPEALPQNVPAVTMPLPAVPHVPPKLAAMGFTRSMRLYGDYGEVAFAFIREEPGGFTLVGDDAVAAIEPANFESEIARVSAEQRAEWVDHFNRGEPWNNPEYPVAIEHYRVWDDMGREPVIRHGGSGWQVELGERGWSLGMRHGVMRVRIREEAANRPGGRR